MISNPVIDTMMNRKSIRKYREEQPSDDMVETIVRAGLQAPFAMQMGSLLLSRKLGLWGEDPEELLKNMEMCGFSICSDRIDMKD